MEDPSSAVGPSPLSISELETPKVVRSFLKQPKTFAIKEETKENNPPTMNAEIKKENIPPEEEFPVIKRKAEEVMAERPSKVTKKEEPLTRKKVPVTTTTRQPLKEKNVGLNAKVNQFSTSLRSSTTGSRLNQSMRVSSTSSNTSTSSLNSSFRQPLTSRTLTSTAKRPALKKESSLNMSSVSAKGGSVARLPWDLKGRLEDMEAKLKACLEKNEQLGSQVNTLHDKVGEKEQTLTVLSEEKVNLKGTLDGRQGEIMDLMRQNRDLVMTIEQIRTDTMKQIEQVQERNRMLESQLEFTKTTLTTTRVEADSLRNTVATQNGQIFASESQINDLKVRLQTAEQLNMERAAKIAELEQIIRERDEAIRQLEEKSREDENLRRGLHNQIQELKGNIRVFCRVRPGGSQSEEEPVFQFPPNTDSRALEITCNTGASVTGKAGASKKMNFNFDKVFQPGSTQSLVFQEISQLVQSVLDGYNTCIFTYGQTGSGKTYTMEGPPRTSDNTTFGVLNDEHRGMIPRTVEQIFTSAKALESKGWKYEMEASFLEIYNETIRDLLSKKSEDKHEIKHEANGTITVAGLSSFKVTHPASVYELLTIAGGNRAVGRTNCNERSSRSHSVFQLKLKGVNTFTDEKVSGILNLIDLAGSERLSQSGATGDRLKETQNINKSLSSLADVICALANKDQHIPYRNSKLTHLLMNSLGGNSKTLMFVNISPEGKDFNETLSSLRFATKVNACEIGVAKKQQRVDFNK
eukprot:Phypoly_transcript_00675.p1 GENE.Phypoly_transcript_00675~~Phypoly_transcript_00675.p1  ORF type:complete len:750 (-),score=123.44 Phypoly_transcript_00675:136-2385(-)